ncbi:MAG: hypothetical protein H6733_04080 [Alphaproteobacteria bacterium]|nr:hypothetical protein [Alphaproteobacteria bacterium]
MPDRPSAALRLCATLLGITLASGCPSPFLSPCLAGPLSESHFCGDDGVSCGTLADQSKGCMGSHTEQTCQLGPVPYVVVGGDDASTLFFGPEGALAAVRRVGEGTDTCEDAWFGLDLTGCQLVGEPERVPCDHNGF